MSSFFLSLEHTLFFLFFFFLETPSPFSSADRQPAETSLLPPPPPDCFDGRLSPSLLATVRTVVVCRSRQARRQASQFAPSLLGTSPTVLKMVPGGGGDGGGRGRPTNTGGQAGESVGLVTPRIDRLITIVGTENDIYLINGMRWGKKATLKLLVS